MTRWRWRVIAFVPITAATATFRRALAAIFAADSGERSADEEQAATTTVIHINANGMASAVVLSTAATNAMRDALWSCLVAAGAIVFELDVKSVLARTTASGATVGQTMTYSAALARWAAEAPHTPAPTPTAPLDALTLPAVSGRDVQADLDAATDGDTVWLDGGTYTGDLTVPAGVTLRALAFARAVIDGKVTLLDNATVWGLEITQSVGGRLSNEAGSDPGDLNVKAGIYGAASMRVINCFVHDTTSDAIEWFGSGAGEVYGTIVANYGWRGPDRGHGHGLYTHNHNGGQRTIKHNIFHCGFGILAKAYSATTNATRDYTVEENALIGERFIIGSERGTASNIRVLDNVGYGLLRTEFGLHHQYEDLTLADNTFHCETNELFIRDWQTLHSSGNRFITTGLYEGTTADTHNTGENTWYTPTGKWHFVIDEQLLDRPVTLHAVGWEIDSCFEPGLPDGVWTWVWQNDYETERGHVVVWNWTDAETIDVDLSALELAVGKTYRAHWTAALHQGWFDFEYTGDGVAFPLSGWAVPLPRGWDTALVRDTCPSFGAFLVLPPGALGEAIN